MRCSCSCKCTWKCNIWIHTCIRGAVDSPHSPTHARHTYTHCPLKKQNEKPPHSYEGLFLKQTQFIHWFPDFLPDAPRLSCGEPVCVTGTCWLVKRCHISSPVCACGGLSLSHCCCLCVFLACSEDGMRAIGEGLSQRSYSHACAVHATL